MSKQQDLERKWHLGESEEELEIIDFEFLFWRTYHIWIRWQEDCQAAFNNDDLNAQELALLHVIRMKDRPKTIYELGRLLGRDDMPNIQYNVKKLVGLGYVKRTNNVSTKKTVAYEITKKGIENTSNYAENRKKILLKIIRDHQLKPEQFLEASKFLSVLKSIFEEASHAAAFYKKN